MPKVVLKRLFRRPKNLSKMTLTIAILIGKFPDFAPPPLNTHGDSHQLARSGLKPQLHHLRPISSHLLSCTAVPHGAGSILKKIMVFFLRVLPSIMPPGARPVPVATAGVEAASVAVKTASAAIRCASVAVESTSAAIKFGAVEMAFVATKIVAEGQKHTKFPVRRLTVELTANVPDYAYAVMMVGSVMETCSVPVAVGGWI